MGYGRVRFTMHNGYPNSNSVSRGIGINEILLTICVLVQRNTQAQGHSTGPGYGSSVRDLYSETEGFVFTRYTGTQPARDIPRKNLLNRSKACI